MAASTQQMISNGEAKLQEIADKLEETKAKRVDAKKMLDIVTEKTLVKHKDPDYMIRLFAVQRRLKAKIQKEKDQEKKLLLKKKRAAARTANLVQRGQLFEKLRIDREKGIQEVLKLRTRDIYSPDSPDNQPGPHASAEQIIKNTKVKINYLKSQQNHLKEELLKAHNVLEARLKLRGETYKPKSESKSRRGKSADVHKVKSTERKKR